MPEINKETGQPTPNNEVCRFCLQSENFEAGQIREHLVEWRKITQDQEVLSMVEGVHINFTRNRAPNQCHFSVPQTEAINNEIQDLLGKGVIVPCSHSSPE